MRRVHLETPYDAGVGYKLRILKGRNAFKSEGVLAVVRKVAPQAAVAEEKENESIIALNTMRRDGLAAMFQELEDASQRLGIESIGVTVATMKDAYVNHFNLSTILSKGAEEQPARVFIEEVTPNDFSLRYKVLLESQNVPYEVFTDTKKTLLSKYNENFYQYMSTNAFGSIFNTTDIGLITSSFVVLPSLEICNEARELQLMTGVSGLLYLMTNFIFDLLFYLVPVATICVGFTIIHDLHGDTPGRTPLLAAHILGPGLQESHLTTWTTAHAGLEGDESENALVRVIINPAG
ncbi:hypothetical protein HPB49_024933 [Dermacentor silvarum]|uniref:Uncharacterized protein n=1 Tax=Dermacentor silvarum TaxID=543639 RepID=A0ACB8CNK8_DERSI|nr:hypothetical protein HPB49_024933 [Dermacentor silvarum]